MRFGVIRPCGWVGNGVSLCWCDDMHVFIVWNKAMNTETEDVLMRLIHSGCGYLIQCRLWFAGYGMSESPALFQLLYGMPRTRQQAPAGKRNHLWWNGVLCWSQIWLTGRHGATILPVAPTPVGPNPFSCDPVQAWLLSASLELTQEIHSVQWGLSHYECWKSSHLNNNEKKDTKKRDSCDCIFFCPNKECEFILKI